MIESLENRVLYYASSNVADGILHIHGTAGADRIRVDVTNDMLSVASPNEAGRPWDFFDVDALRGINVWLAAGNDTFELEGSRGLPVTVSCDVGDDAVLVSPTKQRLGWAAAAVRVLGEGGTDRVELFDNADQAGRSFTFDRGTVRRDDLPALAYVDVANVTVNGGSGADKFDVRATAPAAGGRPATTASVFAGAGDDVVTVGAGGATGGKLEAVGGLGVAGDGGRDSLVFRDGGQTAGRTYRLGNTSLSRSGLAYTTYFGGCEQVAVAAGAGADTIDAGAMEWDLHTALTLDGGAGDDLLRGGGYNDRLIGGPGRDQLFGGDGIDTADYSARAAPVTVSLDGVANDGQAGEADNVGAGVENVHGGNGNDTLRGGAGINGLYGGPGNDWLFGKDGNDALHGGAGDDKLYGEAGEDALYGGTGHDELFGNEGRDVLHGENGDDTFHGGDGSDRMYGGSGTDDVPDLKSGDATAECERVYMTVPSDQPQADNWSCGPNSVSRALRFHGYNASYADVRAAQQRDGYLTSRFGMGSVPATLLQTMRKWKADARMETGSNLGRVLQVLGEGRPVVALIGWDAVGNPLSGTVPTKLHYVALTGFDKSEGNIYYTNTDGREYTLSFAAFGALWNWPASGAAGTTLTTVLGVPKRTILY